MDVPPAVEQTPDPPRLPVRGGSGRSAAAVAVGVIAIVVVAVLKPWGTLSAPIADATTEPTRPYPAPSMDRAPAATMALAMPLAPDRRVVRAGPLDMGAYEYDDVNGRGFFNVGFTVPAGWRWTGSSLATGERGEGATITFTAGDVQVYADPCHWARSWPARAGPGVGDLMTALAAQPMRNATTPIDRPAASLFVRDLWPGMALELTVPDDLDLAKCDEGQFRNWVLAPEHLVEPQPFSASRPGGRDYVWAVDVIGKRLIIDAASDPGTPDRVRSDMGAILESIVVGHWG